MREMELWTSVAAVVFALLLLPLSRAARRLFGPRLSGSLANGSKLPPAKTGWLPWVGVAGSFGKAPLQYLRSTQQELGDVFTIHAAGKRMTVVMGDRDLQNHFFSSPLCDFQEALQPYTAKTANMSKSGFSCHRDVHDILKGRLNKSHMTVMCPALSASFHSRMAKLAEDKLGKGKGEGQGEGEGGEMDLMELVRYVMLPCVVSQLFGPEMAPKTEEEISSWNERFVKYDKEFEYAAQLPEVLLREWSSCKGWFLSYFKSKLKGSESDGVSDGDKRNKEKTVLECVLGGVTERSSEPSYSLLLLWASLANAVPSLFWTLCFVLSDSEVLQNLKDELSGLKLFDTEGKFCPVENATLEKLTFTKRCVLESVRLRPPGAVLRKAVKTHTVKGYTIPEGHLLFLSPFWRHRDPLLFPEPNRYKPDRWLECELDKKQFLEGFAGFGGGRYQCPGRWFALMEMQLFVAMVMSLFEFEPLDKVPQPNMQHLVGIPHPQQEGGCLVRFRKKRQQHSFVEENAN